MRFWDSSGLASLLLRDAHTHHASSALNEDGQITTWWATYVECQSAISNNERRRMISAEEAQEAEKRLNFMKDLWQEVEPSAAIQALACRLLRVHDLRAADALQLAAALTSAEGQASHLPFVTNDRRLAAAARKEGFPIIMNKEPRR